MNGLVDALRLIASSPCSAFARTDCRGNPTLSRNAKFSADRWCDSCVARDALERDAQSSSAKLVLRKNYQQAMEANFANQREAFELLGLIDAEFRTDPMSVQCFDLRTVSRVLVCVAARKKFEQEYPSL